ncbi:BTB/POZ protein [Aspergillus caelatus]|uniref:BTB/POZ protein n=2 Tax=Aspergillus subgen. Circumdati TaxID=2720871 RepID=A0A5N7AHJ1_9EURO|nr:BTB/POZ protein [Aspergillus caelatus]KAE8368636.1 BTB/POZ protein [Aspergillus caelatus]KAE8418485.1 BTB/POZ protein [Aspergillus pseudocaelatus]
MASGSAGSEQKEVSLCQKEGFDQEVGDLSASIKRFFISSDFSDLTICTADQEFKVHRLIVCGQSAYFSRLFKANWTESVDNKIQLSSDDPRAVEAMIHFMYGFEYDSSGSDLGRVSPMLFNINVYQVADKFGVPQLKQKAKDKFETIARTCWDMDDYPIAISEAYQRTHKEDRGLRDILVSISREHLDKLLENEDFRTVLEEVLGFAADLVQHPTGNNGVTKYRCPSCKLKWMLESSAGSNYMCPKCGSQYSWNSYIVKT